MLREVETNERNTPTIRVDEDHLSAALFSALQGAMYCNRMHVAPRKIKQVAQDEVGSFTEFQATRDVSAVEARGQQLMRDGLGQQSIIQLASALRRACWESTGYQLSNQDMLHVLEAYTSSLLTGYMAAYEEEQRREQQLAHEAFIRTLNAQ